MKILLFGEFSGLHNNLKDGLLHLGHQVKIAAGMDGYKQISNDLNLDSNFNGLGKMIDIRLKPFLKLPDMKGFDVLQSINPFFPNAKYFPRKLFYLLLRRLNEKFFILAAGSDAYYWKYGPKRLEYGPFKDTLKYDIKSKNYYMENKKAFLYNKKLIDLSHGIIPVMYDYEINYKENQKLLNTIPLPINLKKINYKENKIGKKLVIFHGLSRYGFKGTKYVESAFNELSRTYPNDLELIIDGKLPIKEYLKIMQKADIVIDQVNSHSSGMNALYALAMGKVVLGGSEPIGFKSLGINSSPVINIKPSKESIIESIIKLIEEKSSIPQKGLSGRKFVEDVHCHIKVAEKYLKTWKTSI
jgi:hypothetical protein